MSAMRIVMSIAKENPIPNPVAPRIPDVIQPRPLKGSPFIKRQIPNPNPLITPTTGISFATVLAVAFGIDTLRRAVA